MCALSLIYSYVAVSRSCEALLFASFCNFLVSQLTPFNILVMFFSPCFVCFLFCVFCVLYFFFVLHFLWLAVVSFPTSVRVYRPPPLGGNAAALIKYHTS